MKKLAYREIDPSSTCEFEATGDSIGEVVGKMMKHIKSEHPDLIMGKTVKEMKEMLESKVHE